ncbi:ATP synthase subunit I [Paenibacillus protaetiae]|uniref:ATP synthase subunit I n=1 Tax=Paenibacillus protaetiae TaxID=2509456 RepID=A0A4P6EY07_9BACL|nr:ATP synthase subunit I [Paenibacillus protaetiae]QAY67706.1 ATP synthase subunit I [Paenibacillus protaetiae]
MDKLMKTAVRIALCVAVACLIIWAAVPDLRTVSLGFLLGLAGSLMNAFLLKRRVEFIALRAAGGDTRKRRGIGLSSRIATVLFVAMMAYRFPEKFNMPAALIGSALLPIVILVAASIQNKNLTNGKG